MFWWRCSQCCVRSVDCKWCQGLPRENYGWMMLGWIRRCHFLLRMWVLAMDNCPWNTACYDYLPLSVAILQVPTLVCSPKRTKTLWNRIDKTLWNRIDTAQNWNLLGKQETKIMWHCRDVYTVNSATTYLSVSDMWLNCCYTSLT